MFSFLNYLVTTGDFPYLFSKAINESFIYPYIWSPTNGNGLGQNVSFVLGNKTFFTLTSKFFVDLLSFDWYIFEKIGFLIPFFIISFVSSYLFSGRFLEEKFLRIISALIFSTNTYALMIISGGQAGVSFAYSLTPIILWFLFEYIDDRSIQKKKILIFFVLFALQLMIDPRIAGISLFITLLYILYRLYLKEIKKGKIIGFLTFIIFSIFLNAFWILPLVSVRDLGLSAAYTKSGIISFLSFANFENSISLLHPNYPENIFGKIYFMRPEFLIIPIIAYLGLIFVKDNSKKIYLFFSLLGLIGVFLSKGVNDPFGFFYKFLSDYLPGFILFRDSSKFYLITVTSYSILIPISLSFVIDKLKSFKWSLYRIIPILFLIFWFFSIRHLFILGDAGVFKPSSPDKEYFKLAKLLERDRDFSRTFWIPQWQRFGYFSNTHPAVSANDFFSEYDLPKILKSFKEDETKRILEDRAVEYVILPYDQTSEIFLTDRKYDPAKYNKTLSVLRDTSWLTELEDFGDLKVFRLETSKEHFWSPNDTLEINYKYINPVTYELGIKNAKEKDLIIFAENYSPNWIMKVNNKEASSTVFDKKLNGFYLAENGDYKAKVYYSPQKFTDLGIYIGLGVFVGSVVLLLIKKRI